MSRDLGWDVPDLEKLYARKLWANFSHPIKIKNNPENGLLTLSLQAISSRLFQITPPKNIGRRG